MFDAIFNEASEAAVKAYKEAKPHPVIFGQAVDIFSNKMVPGSEELCTEGVCGFAWINIKPARGPFISWLKKNNRGDRGVYGGWTLGTYDITDHTCNSQSLARKEAACRAFVEVLREYFPGMRIWVSSRLD